MNIKTAWAGHGRIALVALPLLTLGAVVSIFVLLNFRADLDEANRRIHIADQQIAMSHVLSETAHEIDAGDRSIDDTVRDALVTLDRDHYGLRYGDQGLGVSGDHTAAAQRAFATVEPLYDELRTTADRLFGGDATVAHDVVATTAAFRSSMGAVRSVLVDEAAKRSATLLRVEVIMLLVAFLTTVVVFILAPEVKRRREELRRLSRRSRPDHLTGLIRRDPLAERLQYAVARSTKLDEYASVLVVDVDGLSEINQRYGHAAGDRLLQELATRFKDAVRASDTVARLEDDRFAILIEGNHRAEDSGRVAEKIMASLEVPAVAGAHELATSVSIGIAVAPLDGTHPDELLENAEVAMVSAKQLGGNTYQYYSPELKALTRGRLEMLDGLRRALASDKQLRLAFQPKVDLRTGRVTGVEALIRWSHPEQGEILPSEFIPFAEETEVILGLGEWVIEHACRQAAEWDASGLEHLQVSVNVSARQFRNGDLAEIVAKAVADSGIEANRIQIELTEGALVDDVDRARETLAELQALGVTVAIDDFGTGYSSLSYLKRFPIDALKIDRSFVQELSPNSNEAAISTAIIALAHSLDLEVVAEGVEEAHQLAMLERLGCDTVQGYLFAKALPPADLEAFVGTASSPNAAGPRFGGRYVPIY